MIASEERGVIYRYPSSFLPMENKHAFLITAHKSLPLLKTLLSLLDHPRVDFYLHWDKKSGPVPLQELKDQLHHSALFVIPSISVNWGGYSQIRAELSLLSAAGGDYAYLHLLSGVDLPLKPVDRILSFFDENAGKEFVHFDAPRMKEEFYDRFSVYHFFQEKEQRSRFWNKVEWRLVLLQKKLGVSRLKKDDTVFGKGANWFSITGEFAAYLLSRKDMIRRYFKYSRCCDEVFLQTCLMRSPFYQNLYRTRCDDDYHAVMRYIDWQRGSPYTFREGDERDLFSSDYLFARKFDETTSPKLIHNLIDHIRLSPQERKNCDETDENASS